MTFIGTEYLQKNKNLDILKNGSNTNTMDMSRAGISLDDHTPRRPAAYAARRGRKFFWQQAVDMSKNAEDLEAGPAAHPCNLAAGPQPERA